MQQSVFDILFYSRIKVGHVFFHIILKRVLYMNLETTRPRCRPRNRWQDEVTEVGRIIGGEERQEKLCDREEWKKLLRTASNHRILHMPME
jgi:hypothetical protein